MNWDKIRKEGEIRQGISSERKFNQKTKIVRGFPAKYPGICFICKESIVVGDNIKLFAKGKAYHVGCIG